MSSPSMIKPLNESINNLSMSMSQIQEQINNQKLNDAEKLIDFNKLEQDYTDMMEFSLPFSTQNTEDVIFISRKRLISLDYIFYDRGQEHRYSKLKKLPAAENEIEESHMTFKPVPIEFQPSPQSYLGQRAYGQVDRMKQRRDTIGKHKEVKFIKIGDKEKPNMAEALLSIWHVTNKGTLKKTKQISFEYDAPYTPSEKKNMRLQLSQDMRYVSLGLIQPTVNEDGEQIQKVHFMAWDVKDLRPLIFKKALLENLTLQGELESISMIGESNMILVTEKRKQTMYYRIHNVQSGNVIFKYENLMGKSPNEADKTKLYCIGLLFHRKVSQEQIIYEKDHEVISEASDDSGVDSSESDGRGPDDDAESDQNKDQLNPAINEAIEEDNSNEQDSNEEDEMNEGGEANLNLLMSVFFASDLANEDGFENDSENWYAVRLEVDLQSRQKIYQYNFKEELKKDALSEFKKHVKNNDKSSLYAFPKDWMVSPNGSYEKYLMDISIVANKNVNKFGFLNMKKNTYIAFGESMMHVVSQLDNHKFRGHKVLAYHGRNQSTKDNLYFHYGFGNEIWTNIYSDDPKEHQQGKRKETMLDRQNSMGNMAMPLQFHMRKKQKPKVQQIQEDQEQINIQKHTMIQRNKLPEALQDAYFNEKTQMIQGVTINKKKEVFLKTAIKQDNQDNTFTTTYVRRMASEQRVQTSFPLIAYNIGMSKIVFQNTISDKNAYIYELPNHERFLDFLQFNSLKDLKFDPGKTNLDACSQIMFLTQRQQRLIVNLMIIDPYLSKKGYLLFQSQHGFNQQPSNLLEDEIKNSIIYSTKGSGGHMGRDIHILLQYQSKIEFLTMNFQKQVNGDEEDYDRLTDGGSEGTVMDENNLDDEKKYLRYETVKAIINDTGDIYYVTNYDGQCTVWEINSQLKENEAKKIYEIRTSQCLGFCYYGGAFFLMEDSLVINKLVQNMETRQLDNTEDFYLKEKDKPNFEMVQFGNTIIREKYIIHNQNIFYLHKNEPYMDGILDMEGLLESLNDDPSMPDIDRQLTHGAIDINGSQQFILMYQNGNFHSYKLRVYQMPDSMYKTMIRDKNNVIDLATYLDDGYIFLKMGKRFMLFDQNGTFVREIQFKVELQDQVKKKQTINFAQKLGNQVSHMKQKIQQEAMKRRATVMNTDILEQMSQQTNLQMQYDLSMQDQMNLIAISDDSNYYLFIDTKKQIITLQEIQGKREFRETFSSQIGDGKVVQSQPLWFEVIYRIDWQMSKVLTEDVEIEQEDGNEVEIAGFKQFFEAINNGQIIASVDKHGNVVFTYSQKPVINYEQEVTIMNVMGCKFLNPQKAPKDSELLVEFKQKVQFPKYPYRDVEAIISYQRDRHETMLQVEQINQQRLHEKFKNMDKMEQLKQKLKFIKHRIRRAYMTEIIDKYLIVQCGRFIKVVKYEKDFGEGHNIYQKEDQIGLPFILLDINLSHQHEISKILAVDFQEVDNVEYDLSEDLIQIVAKDNYENILIIATWDCERNVEYAMYQVKGESNTFPENYIVRGMNNRLNFFMDETHIYDLEYQIPQQRVKNELNGVGVGFQYINQRKIFWNNTRNLSVEYPNTLYIPMTRMDITFWKNVNELDCEPQVIAANTNFSNFNSVFNGHSLFHYFAKNQGVIEMLHQKYIELRDDEDVKKEDFNTPLMLLHPNLNGKTALDIAIDADRPVCFELFIDMLEDFENQCLSKMLLKTFPYMIHQGSEIMYKFFNTCNYQPETLKVNFRIPWPYELHEVIFASHTVLISEDQLIKEVAKELTYFRAKQFKDDTFKWLNRAETKRATESQKRRNSGSCDEQQKEAMENALYLRDQALDEDVSAKKKEAQVRRIDLQCIDFDWIFNSAEVNGEVKNNVLTLIDLLSDEAVSNKLYKQTSFRIFIHLLWEEYRPRIIRKQLIPFLVYLGVQTFMAIGGSSAIDNIPPLQKGTGLVPNTKEQDGLEDLSKTDYYMHWIIIVCLVFSQIQWARTTWNELSELRRDGFDYFKDAWNYIDVSLTVVSQAYMGYFSVDMILNVQYFAVTRIRTLGGVTLFLLWIKMFYWMRLFSQTAYFIKLILATLFDIKQFLYIVLIIMTAFVTIFYVFSCNEEKYIKEYTGNKLLDSILTVYFIMQGEFYTDNYGERPNNMVIWPMFLVCNFLLACIFLNMLVAIMMETFSDVNSHKIESDLEQKLALMSDYSNLFDINEVFGDQKYIIYAKPAVSVTSYDVDYVEELETAGNKIIKSFHRKFEELEKNNRQLQRNQSSKITNIQRSVYNLKNQLNHKK